VREFLIGGARVEGPLHVVYPPVFAAAAAPVCDLVGDDVEAHLPGDLRVIAEPGGGASHQAGLLGVVDGGLWCSEVACAASLHLDEDHECSTAHDEIHLHAARSDVASENAIPSELEEPGRPRFALTAEGSALLVHFEISAGPGRAIA
jgi:hypothetical protein